MGRVICSHLHLPIDEPSLGTGGTFFAYGAVCVVGAAFVFVSVPETKGRSLEQIEKSEGHW